MSEHLDAAVAILGMSGRFPGAADLEAFWRNLRDGVDSVRYFSEDELHAFGVDPKLIADPAYVRAAAQPPGLDEFDAGFFGINHREAELLDPQQRMFLELCWEALEDAAYDAERLDRVTGVFAGQTTSTYLLFNLVGNPALMESSDPLQLLVGNAGDSLATRVSYKLNLKGPSYTIQSACSTSAVAVHAACQSLLNSECDVALAGGVSINTQLLTGYRAADGSVFSRSGKCRAFDAGAEGILFGGGGGVVVLKRLEDALADGDNIHAVVLGSAVNNDGALKVGYTAPSVEGQAEVISEALGVAGVPAESLSYIEAHGTGTRLGDPIEIQALTKAFRDQTERRQFIALGSVKTNVGHLDVAAGIAGLLKTVLALKHGQIPPSLHFERPNPEIDFASSPVFVNTELRSWEGSQRRAGVSSFGFGGTNAHLILEEAPQVSTTSSHRERYFLPVSARSEEALRRACQRLADHLEDHPELDLADVEYTLQVGRRTFEHSRVVECRTREEAIAALRALTPDPSPAPPSTPSPGEGRPHPLESKSPPLPGRVCSGERERGPGGEGRRVSLPTYPFERRRYWIDRPGMPVPQVAIVASAAARTFHPRPNLFTPYEPPRDERETKVCQIWQEILGVEPVGIRDDFFQLGGHSLLATQVLSRVRDAFLVDFPLEHLFSFPTAADLAEAIGFLQEEETTVALQIPTSPLRETFGPYPLSFPQERLWFLESLQPGGAGFNIPMIARLQGALDIAALRESLQLVVDRHESLRTRLPQVEGQPVQEILATLAVPLPLADLGGLAEPAAEAERLLQAHASRPFDLVRGPLIAALLLRASEEDHRLAVTAHHTVCDGWSIGVLQRDLARIYAALVLGSEPVLPALPIQYADFADWQRHRFTGAVLEEALAFWRPRLEELPYLELHGDRPRLPVQSFRGANEDVRLPADLALRLEELARGEGASLFMVLLAGFDLLLQRWAQQDDFAVGALVANRNRAEIEDLIGPFINNLPLRADLSGDPTVRELLARVRANALAAYAHQDLPFEKLLEELRPERDPSRGALVQAGFNLLNFPAVREELPGLTLHGSGVRGERANFDLTLWLSAGPDGLSGWLEHNADLFDCATVQRMAGHLERLLAGLAENTERRIADLPWLGEAELDQVLLDWNRTARPRPEVTFTALFHEQAARTPDAIAVLHDSRGLTYSELDRRSSAWARRLVDRGVGRGVEAGALVAILAERGLDFLTAVLAVLEAGGAWLPLDPIQPARRLLTVLRQSGAVMLLSGDGRGAQLLAGEEGPVPEVLELDDLDRSADGVPLPPRQGPDDLAYVIFTSGSTGLPKGAMIHQRGMLNHLLAKVEDLGLTAADGVAQNASQSFDISVWQLLAALLVGGRVHILSDEVAHSPEALLDAVERENITVLEVVPSLLAALLDPMESCGVPRLEGLRWLIPTGEALLPDLCRRWLALRPEVPLVNAYGPTECSDDVTHHILRRPPPSGAVHVPIGGPVANTRLYVVDDGLRPLPAGVPGELCVGGLGVGRGYLGDAERTARAFVPDPFAVEESGGRLYRTGDLVRWLPDGVLEFLERIDQQIKVRGHRIEVGEIEAVLARHPEVREAAVLAVEVQPGDKRLAAYLAPRSGGAIPARDLRAYLRERLPEPMVPSAYVVLDGLPLTPNGKIDRKALPPPVWGQEEDTVAPRTPLEERLAGIWKDLLGVDRVGVFDSFFDVGGHSLLATRLVHQVQNDFGIDLPLRSIFEAPVLAEMALVIEELILESQGSVEAGEAIEEVLVE